MSRFINLISYPIQILILIPFGILYFIGLCIISCGELIKSVGKLFANAVDFCGNHVGCLCETIEYKLMKKIKK